MFWLRAAMAATSARIERLEPGMATIGFRWMVLPAYRPYLERADEGSELIAIGARIGLTPIGVLVGESFGEAARIVSIFVHPRYRKLGCGRRLLCELEAIGIERGIRRLIAGGVDGSISPAIARLLRESGFGDLEEAGTCYELRARNLGPLLTRRDRWLPATLTTKPWTSLSDDERRRIAERQAQAPWYPESLSPFRHEATIEPTTSLALLAGGEVAGWAIGHRHGEHTIHYATIFVREDLRNLGAGAGLFFTALSLHCRSHVTRQLSGRFLVRDESTRMSRMVERRLAPFTTQRARYFETSKDLAINDKARIER